MTKYYENGNIMTKVEFSHAGYDKDAKSVSSKKITIFSIEKGVIKESIETPKCFYRY